MTLIKLLKRCVFSVSAAEQSRTSSLSSSFVAFYNFHTILFIATSTYCFLWLKHLPVMLKLSLYWLFAKNKWLECRKLVLIKHCLKSYPTLWSCFFWHRPIVDCLWLTLHLHCYAWSEHVQCIMPVLIEIVPVAGTVVTSSLKWFRVQFATYFSSMTVSLMYATSYTICTTLWVANLQ